MALSETSDEIMSLTPNSGKGLEPPAGLMVSDCFVWCNFLDVLSSGDSYEDNSRLAGESGVGGGESSFASCGDAFRSITPGLPSMRRSRIADDCAFEILFTEHSG